MRASNTLPVCATCGDRVGVYEPLWAEHADGTLIRTGMLQLDQHRHGAPGISRLHHLGCLTPEDVRRRAA
ncbi:MAG TPA: hypothetical protein VLW51_02440 [Solirubrobacteraceae bacterium]|jgi:hypothetical protein|nr:hypothetical protein [Solirubrobacteraceae bacterium]